MLDNSRNVDISPDEVPPQPSVGTAVYDARGSKLGSVSRYDPQQTYFVMEQGVLFHKDIYVPLDAICGSHADGIRLYLTKDDLHSVKWDQPPASTTHPITDDDILRSQRGTLDEPPEVPQH